MGVLAIALVIDVMKPASSGLSRRMRIEYGVDAAKFHCCRVRVNRHGAGSFVWVRSRFLRRRLRCCFRRNVCGHIHLRRHASFRWNWPCAF